MTTGFPCDTNALVVGFRSDWLAGLILDLLGPDSTMAPTIPDGETRPIVFLSPAFWLANLDRMGSQDAHIVLRNRDDADSDAHIRTILSFVAAAVAQPEKSPRFWAISQQDLDVFGQIPRCAVGLLPQARATAAQHVFRIDPAAACLVFTTDDQQTTAPLAGFNPARLRRDAVLAQVPDTLSLDQKSILRYSFPPAPAPGTQASVMGGPPRFVFVVSNGLGLGHLTRMLAIATQMRHLGHGQILFWCYSRAAGLIAAKGFAVVLRSTSDHLQENDAIWRERETAELSQALRTWNVRAVVVDGSALIKVIADAVHAPGCERTALIWVRRGLWQTGADETPLDHLHRCDLVLVPGELVPDLGVTARYQPKHLGLAQVVQTPPVVSTAPDQMLTRSQARQGLGLGRWGKLCLVSLGSDSLADHGVLTGLIQGAATAGTMRFVWLLSPFSSPDVTDHKRIERLKTYPIAPYLHAFDAVISATGNNSFHELMLLSRARVLLSPSLHARLDDQGARAAHADKMGWAQHLDLLQPASAHAQFARFLRAETPQTRPDSMDAHQGVRAMAAEILKCAGLALPGALQ